MPTAHIPDPARHDTDFAADWHPDPGGAIVTVVGEIDMETAPELTDALFDAIDQAPAAAPVYLDLHGVTLLASAGLAALIAGHQRCRTAGRQLVVVADQPMVLRVLRITDLDTTLTIRSELPGRTFPPWPARTAIERAAGA